MTDERQALVILGREIGTYLSWDVIDTSLLAFYDYEPKPGISLPKAEVLSCNFETGELIVEDVEGNALGKYDMVTLFQAIPKGPSATSEK